MSPYIEAKVIQCSDNKLDILRHLEEKAIKRLDAKISWNLTSNEDPILRVDYHDEEAFWDNYSRDKHVFERLVKFIQGKKLNLVDFIPKTSNKDEFDSEIYLTLKYRTDCLAPIRHNYFYTSKIVEYVGIRASYEEIQDGFLWFYKSKEDFQNASMDLMNFSKIKSWAQEQNIWNDDLEDFFKIFSQEI